MPSITDLQRLIRTHERRLQKLKEQQALYGPQVNPATLIDIEDTEAQLAQLSRELAAAQASTQPSCQADPPPGSILIVEDEQIWQEILQEGLTEAGYQVELATSFSEAKTKLNQTRFSLVTLDARLHAGSNRHDGMLLLDYIHNRFGALLMSAQPWKVLVRRPSAVAVHDYRYVTWNPLLVDTKPIRGSLTFFFKALVQG